MKSFFLCVCLISLLVVSASSAETKIVAGQSIDEVTKIMTDLHYRETGLEMAPRQKGDELKMWTVGEGALILTYQTKTRKVTHISFYLSDERPKATRKSFDFEVVEFDAKTREMKIVIPSHSQSIGKP